MSETPSRKLDGNPLGSTARDNCCFARSRVDAPSEQSSNSMALAEVVNGSLEGADHNFSKPKLAVGAQIECAKRSCFLKTSHCLQSHPVLQTFMGAGFWMSGLYCWGRALIMKLLVPAGVDVWCLVPGHPGYPRQNQRSLSVCFLAAFKDLSLSIFSNAPNGLTS